MKEMVWCLGIGYILDLLLGDPIGLWHPVCGIGFLIQKTEQALRRIFPKGEKAQLFSGFLLVLVVLTFSVGVPLLLLSLVRRISFGAWFVLACIMCYQLLATKSLKEESQKVYQKLKEGDLEASRSAVARIVGRDTEHLSKEEVAKAAIETIAENTSDGVVAPIFYMALFGPLGGFFYKAVNTMDSMVGYKNDTYFYFGRCAARLDDLVNWIPARLAAGYMILAAFLLKLNGKNAIFIYKRDRYNHASPNSAQTESVCAGALEVQLAGDAYYFGKKYKKKTIGDDLQEVSYPQIKIAHKLLYVTSFLGMLNVVLGYLGIYLLLF